MVCILSGTEAQDTLNEIWRGRQEATYLVDGGVGSAIRRRASGSDIIVEYAAGASIASEEIDGHRQLTLASLELFGRRHPDLIVLRLPETNTP